VGPTGRADGGWVSDERKTKTPTHGGSGKAAAERVTTPPGGGLGIVTDPSTLLRVMQRREADQLGDTAVGVTAIGSRVASP